MHYNGGLPHSMVNCWQVLKLYLVENGILFMLDVSKNHLNPIV
jgi:hypothetical protein